MYKLFDSFLEFIIGIIVLATIAGCAVLGFALWAIYQVVMSLT
jgi:hypothetical protein